MTQSAWIVAVNEMGLKNEDVKIFRKTFRLIHCEQGHHCQFKLSLKLFYGPFLNSWKYLRWFLRKEAALAVINKQIYTKKVEIVPI